MSSMSISSSSAVPLTNNVGDTQSTTTNTTSSSGNNKNSTADKLGVVLQGYLKKQKTMKKKYFVLVSDNNGEKPARLEYYDSEKKFRSRFGHPKRSIGLRQCFHISRRLDTKQKYVIALYTREDSFCIVMENESEMNKWLKSLQTLHRHEESEVDVPRTTFGKWNFSIFYTFLASVWFVLYLAKSKEGASGRVVIEHSKTHIFGAQ